MDGTVLRAARLACAFTFAQPGFELVNFIKDASGNLTLAQAQIDDRAASTSTTSSRNLLFVNASTSSNKTSVIRLINTDSISGTVTATAYSEAGTVVGTTNAAVLVAPTTAGATRRERRQDSAGK